VRSADKPAPAPVDPNAPIAGQHTGAVAIEYASGNISPGSTVAGCGPTISGCAGTAAALVPASVDWRRPRALHFGDK
jgi:hypothetical protein